MQDPNAFCLSPTIQLNNLGLASITGDTLDGGSADACGIASKTVNQTDFTCSHVGGNAVSLVVTDSNSNTDSCTSTVTVEDNVVSVVVVMLEPL